MEKIIFENKEWTSTTSGDQTKNYWGRDSYYDVRFRFNYEANKLELEADPFKLTLFLLDTFPYYTKGYYPIFPDNVIEKSIVSIGKKVMKSGNEEYSTYFNTLAGIFRIEGAEIKCRGLEVQDEQKNRIYSVDLNFIKEYESVDQMQKDILGNKMKSIIESNNELKPTPLQTDFDHENKIIQMNFNYDKIGLEINLNINYKLKPSTS